VLKKNITFFWRGGEGGGHTWVAVGVLNPEWRSHKMEVIVGVQTLCCGNYAWWKRGEGKPCPVFVLYPCICFTTEEKSQKNLSQSIQKVLI